MKLWIMRKIWKLKMKYAYRWIHQMGLQVVQIEHLGGTNYIVTKNGQYLKISKK